ncbi:MAG: hypothetical protein KGS61_17270, partial [Verrucomicrobia bacterium]|nr:hypothetical protein [Verrucomicrobiota bacterium]
TPWGRHDGHEFVFVARGQVFCEFATSKDGERKRYSLERGMAIAFHSALFHSFCNASDSEEAELVAAKPSHSDTAAKWRQSHPGAI